MSSVIAYGSLMSIEELARQGLLTTNLHPATVLGFQRSFSQEPSWRQGTGNKRGVLTVTRTAQAFINAILVSGIPASAYAAIDERERGYNRILVAKDRILSFSDGQVITTQSDFFFYVWYTNVIYTKLEPNTEYLKLCMNAAREWGEAFYDTFRKTSFILGTPLSEHPAIIDPKRA